mgnify:CR=1 FL=1
MRVDKVGKEEVQLTHGYVDVVGVDAQVGMQTIGRLLQPFTMRQELDWLGPRLWSVPIRKD